MILWLFVVNISHLLLTPYYLLVWMNILFYSMLSVICGDFNVHKSSWLHSTIIQVLVGFVSLIIWINWLIFQLIMLSFWYDTVWTSWFGSSTHKYEYCWSCHCLLTLHKFSIPTSTPDWWVCNGLVLCRIDYLTTLIHMNGIFLNHWSHQFLILLALLLQQLIICSILCARILSICSIVKLPLQSSLAERKLKFWHINLTVFVTKSLDCLNHIYQTDIHKLLDHRVL